MRLLVARRWFLPVVVLLCLLCPALLLAQTLPPSGGGGSPGGGFSASTCVDTVGVGITAQGTLVCAKVTGTMTDSTIAKTGVDISATGQIISTHLQVPLPFAQGGTGLASGAAGGLPYFPTTTSMGSSATLGAGLPVVGGGSGLPPSTGTKTGAGTLFATALLPVIENRQLAYDSNGEIIATLFPPGTPTQAGLSWAVTVANCTSDSKGGKLTITGSNQIVCAPDQDTGTGGGPGGAPVFPDGGAVTLVCGPGQQGKVQVLDNGELQYCDGAPTAQLHSGVPTQTGLVWNVNAAACLADTLNNGKLTVNGAGQIVCATDAGSGVVSAGTGGRLAGYIGSGNTLGETNVVATQVVTAVTPYAAVGRLVQAAGVDRTTSDSGILAAQVATGSSAFVAGNLVRAAGNDRTLVDSGILASAVCTTGSLCSGYQGTITWGAGLTAAGATAAVASQEPDFLTSGGTTSLTCGAGNRGKAQVLSTGEFQYCDGAPVSQLHSGFPTQAGLSWAVTPGTCVGDSVNNGKLTVNGSGQIICASDAGSGTVSPGIPGNVTVYLSGTATVGDSGLPLAQVVTAPAPYFVAGRLIQSAGANRETGDSGITANQVVTATTPYGGVGHLVQASGANRDTQDSGLTAGQVVTATNPFTTGNLPVALGISRVLGDSGVPLASLCTAGGVCTGYQATVSWGAGLQVTGAVASVASTEAGFLTNGGAIPLTCGAGNAGKAQVLSNGELQYCDGAATPLLRSGVPTQSGLAWNVTAGTCTGDTSGGKLTVNGSSQIVCAPDQGGLGTGDISAVGTTTAGDAFTDSTPGLRLSFSLIATPTTPAAGIVTSYAMATAKNLASLGDDGVVKHMVQTHAAVGTQFLTGIADNGQVTAVQPQVSDLSDAATVMRTNVLNAMSGPGGITGLPVPSNPSDAATKSYVDSVSGGLVPRGNARVGTTAPLTVTYSNGTAGVGATLTNAGTQAALVLDGVTLLVNDLFLVKNQASKPQNGLYVVTNAGSGSTNWVGTRATNYDQNGEIVGGSYIVTTSGTQNANILWIETTPGPFTVGTTDITFDAMGVAPQTVTLTGDTTGSGLGTVSTTTSKLNGVAFAGTTGHLVQFASGTTPGDSGLVASEVVTAPSPFTSGQVMVAAGAGRTASTTGIAASSLCTNAAVCTGYQEALSWGAGVAVSGSVVNVASTEAGFLTDGGTTALTCGAGNQGKAQVMDTGELQYCDGASTSVLHAGVPTQSGLTWNATVSTCTSDTNGGKLTINGSNQIVCAPAGSGAGTISAVGTVTSGQAFTDTTPGARFTFGPITTPTTPASGGASVYVDATTKTLYALNDVGILSHTVQSKSPVAHQFVTSIADNGVVTAAQPALADLSDGGTVAVGSIASGTASYASYYTGATALGPSSAFKFDGTTILSMKPHITTVTNSNLTLTDNHTVLCSAGALDRTIQLPSAATTTVGYYKVIKSDTGVGACNVARAGSDLINGATAAASALTQWSTVEAFLIDSGSPGQWHVVYSTATPFLPSSKTATYQVTTADFAQYATLTVPSGTFTVTLVDNTKQPAAGQFIHVVNYGSGVVTIARAGQNLNGGTTSLTLPAASATAPTSAFIVSDGTNYFAWLAGATSGGATKGTIHIPVQAAKLPTSGAARVDNSGNNTVLLFDGATDQCAIWGFVVPQDYGSNPKVRLEYRMTSDANTSHGVTMNFTLMDTAPGAAVSIETDSYGANNLCTDSAVPGTVLFPDEILCTITNTDGLTAGHNGKLKVCRATTDAGDTATGDLGALGILLEYTKN